MILPYEKLGIHAGVMVVDEKLFTSRRNDLWLTDSDRKAKEFLLDLIQNASQGDRKYWFRCEREENLIKEILEIPHTTLMLEDPKAFFGENRVYIHNGQREILTNPLPKILTDILFGDFKCIVVIPAWNDIYAK